RVCAVARDEAGFVVRTEAGAALHARHLVVATGVLRPFVPPIPGIEAAEGYETVPLEPECSRAQRNLAVGHGNAGVAAADKATEPAALVHLASPRPVRLAWRTRHPGNVRANYVRLLDTYQLKLLNGVLDCKVLDIRRERDGFAVTVSYLHADGEQETLHY